MLQSNTDEEVVEEFFFLFFFFFPPYPRSNTFQCYFSLKSHSITNKVIVLPDTPGPKLLTITETRGCDVT